MARPPLKLATCALTITVAVALRHAPDSRPCARPRMHVQPSLPHQLVARKAPLLPVGSTAAAALAPHHSRAAAAGLRMSASPSPGSAMQQLWPNTICKFWGLHACAWSVASVALAVSMRSILPVPLAVSNLILARFLYITQEDVRRSLSTLSGVFFSAHAALLWRAPLATLIGRPLPCLQILRLWHALLAAGSFAFATEHCVQHFEKLRALSLQNSILCVRILTMDLLCESGKI